MHRIIKGSDLTSGDYVTGCNTEVGKKPCITYDKAFFILTFLDEYVPGIRTTFCVSGGFGATCFFMADTEYTVIRFDRRGV